MTELESFRIMIQTTGNIMGIFIAPLMTVIIVIKLWKEYKEIGQMNILRLILLGIFIAFTWSIFWTNLYESTTLRSILDEEIVGIDVQTINFFSVGIGFMVTFSICLITYANQWEKLYYPPIIIFGAILVFCLITSLYILYTLYIYITALFGLAFFYITGFRLKDNGTFGLGIFFTLCYLALAFEVENLTLNIISQFFNLSIFIFGLIFVLGYFRPFGESEDMVRKE